VFKLHSILEKARLVKIKRCLWTPGRKLQVFIGVRPRTCPSSCPFSFDRQHRA
jgi:hypothetical protein